MAEPYVCEQMREDWNRRAREDAKYYVAFGRHAQGDDEFFATGKDLARGLERELKWLPAGANRRAWRALEIGCGLGRLMLPLSRAFGEIHGVDVADEMVRQAREKLQHIPHAHVHLTAGADLAAFADESFEFVYSYAVFQHIPLREVVFEYLSEARRVLKTGGIFRFQVNGLPGPMLRYDTWSGVRISAAEIAEFAREHDFQLLALEGTRTQYLWVTLRKQPHGWFAEQARRSAEMARIRRITNAHSSEPVAPSRGRFAVIALWLEGLPEDGDLNTLKATVGGLEADLTYLGPPAHDLQQLNVELPASVETGLQPVRVFRLRKPLTPAASVRVIPPGPLVPRVVAVTDGIDLLSGTRIVSRSVKVNIEEVAHPEQFEASVDGLPVTDLEHFCTDPRPPLHEVNFSLPGTLGAGAHQLEMRIGQRSFAPVPIEVV
ncbi:MAG: class I SAM-dependent methyltransferase [Acidobacteriota bacterium]